MRSYSLTNEGFFRTSFLHFAYSLSFFYISYVTENIKQNYFDYRWQSAEIVWDGFVFFKKFAKKADSWILDGGSSNIFKVVGSIKK